MHMLLQTSSPPGSFKHSTSRLSGRARDWCIGLLILMAIGQSMGCATPSTFAHAQYMVEFDSEGMAVEREELDLVFQDMTSQSVNYQTYIQTYLDTVIGALKVLPDDAEWKSEKGESCVQKQTGRDGTSERVIRLMVFVHGGLSTESGAITRVKDSVDSVKKDCTYPIYINWDSSLFSSYVYHLYCHRRGYDACSYNRLRDKPGDFLATASAPFFFIADFGRAVTRMLPLMAYQFKSQIEPFPTGDGHWYWKSWDGRDLREAQLVYEELGKLPKGERFDIAKGADKVEDSKFTATHPFTMLLFPFVTLTAPVVDAFGQSAWTVMLRRAQILFDRDDEMFAKREDQPASHHMNSKETQGIGGVSIFLRRLRDEVLNGTVADREGTKVRWEVTLIGHSMGGIVVNEILRRFKDIHFTNVVYLGSAASVKDYESGACPYLMEQHSAGRETTVYHLVLHPKAEIRWNQPPEGMNKLVNLLIPRGSLLVWEDEFLTQPTTILDRTVGRWTNLVMALHDTPVALRKFIKVKVFNAGTDEDPNYHGDFDEVRFCYWKPEFWKPEFLNRHQEYCPPRS